MANRSTEQRDFKTMGDAMIAANEVAYKLSQLDLEHEDWELEWEMFISTYCEPLLWNVAIEYTTDNIPKDADCLPIMPGSRGL